MKLTDLSSHISRWFNGKGPLADIVISSRIRLARNLAGFHFLSRCSSEQKRTILERIKEAILSCDMLHDMFYLGVDKAFQLEKDFLVERHLISTGLAKGKGPRGMVVADDELFTAMINEEDHLRMQVLTSGLELNKCWERISRIDDYLETKIQYAFDPKYGYLTACPTNVGTGIRVSVMLHLPALKMAGELEKFFNSARDLNLAVRGLFGEGTEALGDFFQISNQTTLGIDEEKEVEKFQQLIIPKIVEYENLARKELIGSHSKKLDDKIARALAVLKSAELISSQEAMFLLSNIRLGVNIKKVRDIPISTINELFLLTQPAHLQLNSGRQLSPEQRDLLRAQTIREKLN